jgi:hypothetical protein
MLQLDLKDKWISQLSRKLDKNDTKWWEGSEELVQRAPHLGSGLRNNGTVLIDKSATKRIKELTPTVNFYLAH